MFRQVSCKSFAMLLLTAQLAAPALAAPPQPFAASYDAHYGNFSASATRSLQHDAGTDTWTLRAEARLTLLGATLSSITERSEFRWQDEQPLPLQYEFRQRGAGARQRSVQFDHASGQANFQVNERQGSVPLQGPVFDELNSYLGLRERLAAGETDISLTVLDRDKLEIQRYRVLSEETLTTPLGAQQTVHVERLRESSTRRTELWLAPALDYMLVKLVQTEPNGNVISLDLKSLMLGD